MAAESSLSSAAMPAEESAPVSSTQLAPSEVRAILRRDVRIATVSSFFAMFADHLRKVELDIELLEDDLAQPGQKPESEAEILVADLLISCTNERSSRLNRDTYAPRLKREFDRRQEGWAEGRLKRSWLNAEGGEMEELLPFANLSLDDKIHIIYWLVEWQCVRSDSLDIDARSMHEIERFRRDRFDAGPEWRDGPVGFDAVGNAYWYFYDSRLWIQRTKRPKDPNAPASGSKKTANGKSKAVAAAKDSKKRAAPNGSSKAPAKKAKTNGAASKAAVPRPPASRTTRGRRAETETDGWEAVPKELLEDGDSSELSEVEDEQKPNDGPEPSLFLDEKEMPADWHQWEVICVTVDEWEAWLKQFAGSKHKVEKDMHKYFSQQVLPLMKEDLAERAERLAEKERRRRQAAERAEEAARERAEAEAHEAEMLLEPRSSKRAAAVAATMLNAQALYEPEGRTTRGSIRRAINFNVGHFKTASTQPDGSPFGRVDRARLREMQRIRQQQIDTGMDEWLFECHPCGGVLGQEGTGLLVCCVECSTWSHYSCHPNADQETFICERCAGGDLPPVTTIVHANAVVASARINYAEDDDDEDGPPAAEDDGEYVDEDDFTPAPKPPRVVVEEPAAESAVAEPDAIAAPASAVDAVVPGGDEPLPAPDKMAAAADVGVGEPETA